MDPDDQSVYTVVKTNHSSAYCRYRPRDNQEEPRNTPDALKSGNTGENLALAARNQMGAAPQSNNVPSSHTDGKRANQVLPPEGQQSDTNPNFPPRRQQHTHF